MIARRLGILATLTACIAIFAAVPAGASADHPFLPEHFPPPKPKKKEEVIPAPLFPLHSLVGWETSEGEFADACGLAFDFAGDLFVADHYHDVIDRYDPKEDENNALRFAAEIPDADPQGRPCGLAWSPNGLYVNDYRRGVFWYTNISATEIDPGPATGVAVDQSSGRIYVTHSTYVAVYEPDGTPVMEGSEPMRKPMHIGTGALGDAYGAAVSRFSTTKGYLYVADASDETVKVFDPATSLTDPVQTIDGSLGPQQGFDDLRDSALAIDQSNGNLFVADRLARAEEPPMVVDEFTPSGNFRGQLPHEFGDGEPPGIAVDPVEHLVYVTTGRGIPSGVYAFAPATVTKPLLLEKSGSGEGTVTSTPAGVSCPGSCAAGEAEFAAGSVATLTAVPAPHSAFDGWTVAGQPGACQGTGPCLVQMAAATEVTASFSAIPQQTLTVSVGGEGEGSVLSEPAGIDCGTACSEHFDEGSTVVLTAVPAPHSRLVGWSVAGDPSACPGVGPCEVTLAQATQVAADFAPNPDRTLSLSISGPGRVLSSPAGVDCSASCAPRFADGTGLALEAQPAPGYELLGWSGACSGKRRCLVTLDGDTGVSAAFVRIEDAVAVSVVGAGTGTVTDAAAGIDCGLTCAGIYLRDSVLTLTAKPEAGSNFTGFSGCDSVSGSTCTVRVTEARTVTAVFGEAPQILVRRVVQRGRSAVLSISLPSPGILEARGKGIVRTHLRVRAEGVVEVPLRLSKAGRRALRRARNGRASFKVAIAFTSPDGSTAHTTKIVTFRRSGKR